MLNVYVCGYEVLHERQLKFVNFHFYLLTLDPYDTVMLPILQHFLADARACPTGCMHTDKGSCLYVILTVIPFTEMKADSYAVMATSNHLVTRSVWTEVLYWHFNMQIWLYIRISIEAKSEIISGACLDIGYCLRGTAFSFPADGWKESESIYEWWAFRIHVQDWW